MFHLRLLYGQRLLQSGKEIKLSSKHSGGIYKFIDRMWSLKLKMPRGDIRNKMMIAVLPNRILDKGRPWA